MGANRKRGKTEVKNGLSTTIPGKLSIGDLAAEVVAPEPDFALTGIGGTSLTEETLSAHSLNAVIRVSHGDKPLALFCGDLDESGLSQLHEEGVPVMADVLVFPHHGGLPGKDPETFTATLCEMVRPQVVVFSIGSGRHGTPRPEVITSLRRVLPKVHIACTQLSERCALELPKSHPSHLSDEVALGRDKNHCCAGTLVIFPSPIQPVLEKHAEFVSIEAPTALCRLASGIAVEPSPRAKPNFSDR